MGAKSRSRPSESPSETQALPYTSKNSILLSTSSSGDSDALWLLGQTQHLPAGLAHMHIITIAGGTRASWQDTDDPSGPFYPGITPIAKEASGFEKFGVSLQSSGHLNSLPQ